MKPFIKIALFFLAILLIIGAYSSISEGAEPEKTEIVIVSKERADQVGEAMREYQKAQVEHDCKNSVASRDRLLEAQKNLKVLVRSQQE